MKKHKVVIIVAISLLIGLIVYLFATLDYFSIKKITVKNNKIVKTTEIKNYSNYSLGENIFRFNKNNLRKKLSKDIYIRDANVKKKYPDTIEITIEETKDICYFQLGKDRFFVDSDYNVVKNKNRIDYTKIVKIDGANENLSKINNLQSDEKFYEFIKNLYTNKILDQLVGIDIYNANDITLLTKNEIKVFFGDLNESEKKSNNLFKILKEISTKSINTKTVDIKDPKKSFFIK
ncbi:cell division protein FtsQ/DivIB [uncultured Finegoldia sp.]|uniref:cell division protein FtsQ/DivIB n=1 Tax=uncultured Finegoldia sp. TaxID=328009 RepID=UPI0025EBD330|nr:FtsQ-type POTRA domain-containing protein [uncultured Finegoldia sp.]MDU1832729.1 FtsQ-type POTRA domain-containing protein [Finegoldia magna]